MDQDDFAALLDEYDKPAKRTPKVGEMVKGQVVSIGAETVFVDIGAKSEGALGREQVVDAEGELRVQVGDEIEARVASTKGGSIELRVGVAKGPDLAAELEQAFAARMPVEGLVAGVNKGGVEVQVAGLRGFCPFSQLADHFVEDAESFVGQRLHFRITKLEGGRRPNIVLSRRALLEEENAKRAEELLDTLSVGDVMKGTVKTLKPYGAFVDLGGVEGMLHISELGFSRVEDPSEVLSVGQSLDVQIIKLEKTGDAKRPLKLSLSLKALAEDPWREAASRYTEGQTVKGTIVRLMQFGAFVEVEPGLEGLVHIGALGAERRINHPREVVSVGALVEARVVSVEPERRRLSLTMSNKDAEANAGPKNYKDDNQSLGTFGDLLKNKLS